MIRSFGDAAVRYSAVAAQLLGWRPQDFWAATPRELALALQPIGDETDLEVPSREHIAWMMERDLHD